MPDKLDNSNPKKNQPGTEVEDIASDEKSLLRKVRNATFPRMLLNSPQPGSVEEHAEKISRVINEINVSKQMRQWPVEVDPRQPLYMVRTDESGNFQLSPEPVTLGRSPQIFLRSLERFINRGPDGWESVKEMLRQQPERSEVIEDPAVLEAEDAIRGLEKPDDASPIVSQVLSLRDQTQCSRLLAALGRRIARIFDREAHTCDDFAALEQMKAHAVSLFSSGPLSNISSMELADTLDAAALDLAWKKLLETHDPAAIRSLVAEIKNFPYSMGEFLANPVVAAADQKSEWVVALKRKRSEAGLDALKSEIEGLERGQDATMDRLKDGVLGIIDKKRASYREIWARSGREGDV